MPALHGGRTGPPGPPKGTVNETSVRFRARRLYSTIQLYHTFRQKSNMFVRHFYDSLHQGTVVAHSNGSEVSIRDGEMSRPDVTAQMQVLSLYSDPKYVEFEDHFSDEVVFSPDPSQTTNPDAHPWDLAGTIPRSNRAMEVYRERPLTWMESWDARVLESFNILEQIIRWSANRQTLTCIDGPCHGDMVNINDGESRVECYDCIYGRTEDNQLRYIRASNSNKTRREVPGR